MPPARVFLLAFVATLVRAGPLDAQTTGDIRGTVRDATEEALPGVTVEISSRALQGPRTAVTDASGLFRFPLVQPGTYLLAARLEGFAPRELRDIRVALGETTTVPITLTLAAAATAEVSGGVPLIDTATTRIGTSLPAATLARLPLGRNYSSAMLTVGGAGTDGAGNTMLGATGLENSYIVDGLNTTSVKDGSQGKQLNLEFVQDVEVRAGGYEAEYGKAMGASVNVVTRSGGNEYHGDVFGYYDSESLMASDKHEDERTALSQPLPVVPKRYDVGLGLGGYLLKDRLWFFGAYDRVAVDTDYRRVESVTYTPTSTIPNYVDGTDAQRTDLFSAKLTLRPAPSHAFVAAVFGDPIRYEGRNGINGPPSAAFVTIENGGTDGVARWEGIFGTRFLGQAQYGYHEERDGWYSDESDKVLFKDVRRGVSQAAPGSGPGWLGPGTLRRNAWSATATAFLGGHELKAGVGYELQNSSETTFLSGGGAVSRYRTSATGAFRYSLHGGLAKVPLNCQVRTDGSRGNFGFIDPTECNGWEVTDVGQMNPRTRNLAFFLQDAWKVLPDLTVNVGLRYEEQRLFDAGGQLRIRLTDQWSPRVGVVWDPTARGLAKIHASYGRYYQAIPQYIQLATMGGFQYISAYNLTEDRVDLVNTLAPFEYLSGSDYVSPGLKGIYQDEIVAGVELEVQKGWSVGLKGIYRSLGRVLEDRCDVYDPRSGLEGLVPPEASTQCVLMNPGDGDYGQLLDPANPDCWADGPAGTVPKPCESVRASRFFRGIQLDVSRRLSDRFLLQGSYVYSKLAGNYDGLVYERTGQATPALNPDFDTSDTLVNSYGSLMLDRRHQVRVSGFYVLPFGLQAGVNASFATGAPLSILGWSPQDYSQYLAPRGSWDQLPSTYKIDLHLEYSVRLGPVSVTPVLDVFNLTNVQTAVRRGQVYNNVEDGNQDPPYANPTVPTFGQDTGWQSPRILRLGARVRF